MQPKRYLVAIELVVTTAKPLDSANPVGELNKPYQTQKPLPLQVEATTHHRSSGQCPPQAGVGEEDIVSVQ